MSNSLFYLLFQTMPFAAVEDTIKAKTKQDLPHATIGEVSQYVRYIPPEDIGELRYESPKLQPGVGDGLLESVRRYRSVWGFDATSGVTELTDVTCQVVADGFRRNTIFDRLSFGSDEDGQFDASVVVQVEANGPRHSLELSEENCMARFMVSQVASAYRSHVMWPLSQIHEVSVVWFFAFDIELATGTITPLVRGQHQDPDVWKFHEACMKLVIYDPEDTETVEQGLCRDNLWSPALQGPSVATAVPASADSSTTKVQAGFARIVVCCSATLQKESDDFTPGKPVWAVRVYPHIMAQSSVPLAELSAAVYFERPEEATGGGCGCSEMNRKIGSMLVSDTNADNKISKNEPIMDGPFMYWNNIFNYFLIDPYNHHVKTDYVQVVDRKKTTRRSFDGALVRERDERGRVTRYQRQGVFDNIHVAPTMKMPPVDAVRPLQWNKLLAGIERELNPITDRTAWHLDEIYMAPLCVHDCFHMHWRWTDDTTDEVAWGFVADRPHAGKGAPMVPENQDVFLRMRSPRSFVYKVRAYDCPAGQWQVIDHHGAAYVIEEKLVVGQGKAAMYAVGDYDPVVFLYGLKPVSTDSWAMFYWNMRWQVPAEGTDPQERISIIDYDYLCNETPTTRKKG